MNIDGATTATNYVFTSTVAASDSTTTFINKVTSGTFFMESILPSTRPATGIVYPRYT